MVDDPGVPDGASYDLLRRRLAQRVDDALTAASAIDAERIQTFGSVPVRLTRSDRLRTELTCSPRDMAHVGNLVVLGYNVELDLGKVEPEHVFALYRRGDDELLPLQPDDERNFLSDPVFREEFDKLHRFYGKARFVDLRVAGGQMLAAFSIGERTEDLVVLRWTVDTAGRVSFVDARGDRDYRWPSAHDFSWVACGRDDQVAGAHPAVAVLDEVFVGFRNGRLQLRVEDGTHGGFVAIEEAVDDAGQSLADVSVAFARVGDQIVLLRIGLYNEPARFYIYSRRTRSVERVDAIGKAVRVLPGGEGVVFPGGYHLATAGTRVFDLDTDGMIFEEVVASPNGEDLLYVFHQRDKGEYLLAPYNLVRREINQVVPCHGFATFDNGDTVLFRGGADDAEPRRVHPIQWWTTPFVDDDHTSSAPSDDGWVARVGNADLVSGLADVFDVGRLLDESDPSERTWEALIIAARRALDTNLWLADPEATDLHAAMRDTASTAGLLVDEYTKVRRLRADAAARIDEARRSVGRQIAASGNATTPTDVVSALGSLRRARGEVTLLEDIPEVDDDAIVDLITDLDKSLTALAERAGEVLDDNTAFDEFRTRLDDLTIEGTQASTAGVVAETAARLAVVTSDLDAVVDAVGALDNVDPTARTRIVRRVADITAASNRSRAVLEARRRELADNETAEAFDAEVALLEQTLSGAVMATTTPDEVDTELARLLVNAERLESRHGEDPDRLIRIIELRDRMNEVFGSRRSELVDQRAQRTKRLVDAGERLLVTILRRAEEAEDEAEVASLFAADQMVLRVRDLAGELDELGESGQAAELKNALRAGAEAARRTVRDRSDLSDDDGALRFGPFRFAPNHQPFETVMSTSNGRVSVDITGTDLSVDVTDELSEFADLLNRSYPSESQEVARCEYLAWAVYHDAASGSKVSELRSAAAIPEHIAERVRSHAERRHGEGYEIGVHDHDAAVLLTALLTTGSTDGVGYPGSARAIGRLFLSELDDQQRQALGAGVQAARVALDSFDAHTVSDRLQRTVSQDLANIVPTLSRRDCRVAAGYICDQLRPTDGLLPATSTAIELVDEFETSVESRIRDVVLTSIDSTDLYERYTHLAEWLSAFVAANPRLARLDFDVDEAAAILATPGIAHFEQPTSGAVTASGLVSDHRHIIQGQISVRLDELAARVGPLFDEMATRWPAYQELRRGVTSAVRDDIDLDSHRPAVMAGFVRNRLIDRTLLPLVGANLARQLGTVDSNDLSRSGLLVLTSPPGYGKTTLMSWMAARLGLLMVKVNGPALGFATTSLDPADAPNATARAEVEKVNLALAMARNVVLFIDDIQFTNPEFLSRFIPLADATRRIEGVHAGQARTYDLRSKRFAIVMAGNPYSTAGSRFELPDMLVNRADVYNLGDVADEHAAEFALSYLENSVTACPAIAPRSTKLIDDVEVMVAMSRGRRAVSSDGLDHRWDSSELDETVRVLELLDRAATVVMQVNDAYVDSAASADADREAPPFLLQGSYRNMARISSRIVPAMTDDELAAVIDDHYASEAQTLTDRAEQNLLALAALRGTLDATDEKRWKAIKANFARATADPAADVVAALGRIADALGRQ